VIVKCVAVIRTQQRRNSIGTVEDMLENDLDVAYDLRTIGTVHENT
jgi:hypothetical protein